MDTFSQFQPLLHLNNTAHPDHRLRPVLLHHPLHKRGTRNQKRQISCIFQRRNHRTETTPATGDAFQTIGRQAGRTLRRPQTVREKNRPALHRYRRKHRRVHIIVNPDQKLHQLPAVHAENLTSGCNRPFRKRKHRPEQHREVEMLAFDRKHNQHNHHQHEHNPDKNQNQKNLPDQKRQIIPERTTEQCHLKRKRNRHLCILPNLFLKTN